VDCWSLGVILYMMLGRHLPFDSQDDKEIGQKTIQQEISFSHVVWKNVSEEGKDLISKLLQKDPAKRIKIKQVLDHKWLTMQDPEISILRRKSADMKDQVMEFVAYSNVNVEKVRENSPRAAEKSSLYIGSLKSAVDSNSKSLVSNLKAKTLSTGGLGSTGLFGKKLEQKQ
jgi:serine/threonine protein kinase